MEEYTFTCRPTSPILPGSQRRLIHESVGRLAGLSAFLRGFGRVLSET